MDDHTEDETEQDDRAAVKRTWRAKLQVARVAQAAGLCGSYRPAAQAQGQGRREDAGPVTSASGPGLREMVTAVRHQDRAGDEGRCFMRQEQHARRDLLRCAAAPERSRSGGRGLELQL